MDNNGQGLEWQKDRLSLILSLLVSTLRDRRGSSLVEMALTLPIVLMMLFGTLDLGRAVYAQNVITNAAREGARYGVVPPYDSQAIMDYTETFIIGLNPDEVTVQTEQPSADTVRVTVTYSFSTVTPLVGKFLGDNGTVTLKSVSTMSVEG